jgi:hypothetical protein
MFKNCNVIVDVSRRVKGGPIQIDFNCKIPPYLTDRKFSGIWLKCQIGSHLWKIIRK